MTFNLFFIKGLNNHLSMNFHNLDTKCNNIGLLVRKITKNELRSYFFISFSILLISSFVFSLAHSEFYPIVYGIENIDGEKKISYDDIVILDENQLRVLEINQENKTYSLFSETMTSQDEFFLNISDLVIDSDGKIILLDEDSGCDNDGAVFKMDLFSGNYSLISDNCSSNAGYFSDLEAVFLDRKDQIFILDEKNGKSKIISVENFSGNQTLIHDFSISDPNVAYELNDLEIDSEGNIVLVGQIIGVPKIIKLNPKNGEVNVISENKFWKPGYLVDPKALTILPNGNILVIDQNAGVRNKSAFIEIDPVNGFQKIILEYQVTEPNLFVDLRDLDTDSQGNFITIDRGPDSIVRVTPTLNSEIIFNRNFTHDDILNDLEKIAIFKPQKSDKKIQFSLSPEAPSDLQAQLSTADKELEINLVQLNWRAPKSENNSNETWYKIERKEAKGNEEFSKYSFLGITNQTKYEDQVGRATIKYQYMYRVIAVNPNGESLPSNEALPIFETNSYLPPLRQFEMGIPSDKISCKTGYSLIFKFNGDPACVRPESVEKLVERGWLQ